MTDDGTVFFRNDLTGAVNWSHPLDDHFRGLIIKLKVASPAYSLPTDARTPVVSAQRGQPCWRDGSHVCVGMDAGAKLFPLGDLSPAQLQQQRAAERARRGLGPEDESSSDDYSSHTDDDVRVPVACPGVSRRLLRFVAHVPPSF